MNTQEIAKTILEQLGGGRFVAMTGASSMSSGMFGDAASNTREPGLSMRIGRNGKGVKGVIITLEPSDTYRLRFITQKRAPSYEVVTLAEVEGVYVSSLREVFERHTDLLTSLGTMGGAK